MTTASSEPLVEEAVRVRMTPFLDACRSAGYHLIGVDREAPEGMLIRAAWWKTPDREPRILAWPAIWVLVARHVAPIGPAHPKDPHCVYTAEPHWMSPGMYVLDDDDDNNKYVWLWPSGPQDTM